MNDLSAGPLVREFRPLVSLSNKKFVLVWLALIVLLPLKDWLTGDYVGGFILTSWLITLPLIYMGMVAFMESSGHRSVAALHENGFFWKSGKSRVFVPWSQVVAVDEKRAHRGGVYWEIALRDGEARGVVIDGMGGGIETVDFVRERIQR